MSFAKAFGREKPHSSTTDWIDILTADNFTDESYDGIPELVDSIKLQASGPTEAIRALRKKLKHGNVHQQYRALVLLKALVENCGPKFAGAVSDSQFQDALRSILTSPGADSRVKRKLKSVLESWRERYQTDPSMASLAGLYKQVQSGRKADEIAILIGQDLEQQRAKEREALRLKEEAKRKAAEQSRTNRARVQRAPFDYEKEKSKILTSIVDASQASSNLSNAIRRVNPEVETVETNTTVQDCLEKAKQVRKTIVRYIQLVENEDLIGTLIETNDHINGAIDYYEQLMASHDENLVAKLAATHIDPAAQNDQKVLDQAEEAVQDDRDKVHGRESYAHPDLQDLSFGPVGSTSSNLPAPIRPTTTFSDSRETHEAHGTLSDYSDYESSNEDNHQGSSARRTYVHVSDDSDTEYPSAAKAAPLSRRADDPFADPFADEAATGQSIKG